MLLDGKRVLITSVSGQLGSAIVIECVRQGGKVAFVGSSNAELEATSEKIGNIGRQSVGLRADVRVRSDIDRAVEVAVETLGQVDVLINSTGVGIGPVPVEQIVDEEWRLVMDTNVRAPLAFVQALTPHFVSRKTGSIVNVSSLAARYRPGLTSAVYAASQSSLCALTRQLAFKLGQHGIRVTAVLPGTTELDEQDQTGGSDELEKSWELLTNESRLRLLDNIPLGRFGTPHDYARTVAWLASDYNSWITGESIAVCGGEWMG